MWDPLLEILPKEFRVIRPDLPGHGSNPQILSTESITAYAQFLEEQLQKEKIEEVVLIGHSMGGYIACEFSKLYPEKVKGLLLFHSTASEDDAEKKINRDRAIKLVQEDPSRYCSGMIRGLFHPEFLKEKEVLVRRLISEALSMNPQAITQALTSMKLRPDSIESLMDRSFPLGYVLGDQDSHLSMNKMRLEMQQTNPEFEYILKECGHMGQWESPVESSKTILNALRQFENSSI